MGEGVTNPAEGNPHYTDPLSRLLHVALLLFGLIAAAVRLTRRHRPPPMADADPPSSADSSFFTWDSGGQDYSFVHTAVELPKYPENAITEEERQMLLLYMQNGHPEVMLTPHQPSSEPSVRGFLETIVEETSDDLRSPSECDETSLGWGSWDESDEDRLTVVEMVTSDATKSAIDSGVLVFSDSKRNDNMDTLMSKPGVSPVSNSLDALWITPDALDSPESLDPWTNCEFKTPSDGLTSLDFTVNTSSVKTDNSLLVVGLDDLCLVPSKSDLSQSEELMFSDNFKDYFLPASDHLTPSFNKDEAIEQGSLSTPDILSNIPEQKSLRCFRIGFESDPTEQVALSLLDDTHINADDLGNGSKISEDYSKLGPIIKSEADALNEEAMFSPVDGDIVYGSTWVSGRDVKEPEKNNASGAEVHCADDNLIIPHHSASDDEAPKSEVPKSLSRWQHHSDLQHVQEATSPLARWQHHGGEPKPDKPAENTAEDESDDGLPPQLKEIYSSFKMKDNKMGRIRIKEDKNNNFKRLGLWDNESKVTLPPFKPSLIDPPINVTQKPIENGGGSREDLDDLEFDMFSTQGKSKPENNSKPPTNCDSDIDDALKSFNHLDDYSSQSDDCSEAENGAPFNVVDLENALSAIAQCSGTTPIPEAGPSSLCSDTSDNSPLCTDTGFKNSVDDLLGLEHDILLPKTFPKMKTLAPQSNSDDSEQNADSLTKPSDSASPLTTTSDSDEGVRAVKEVKKRTKKRPKDSQSSELKHDDSGYVEDDEDDEEDDSLEEKLLEKDSIPNADVVRTTRKSISTAYYESKSKQGEEFDSGLSSQIPCTYKEFSEQLEQSLCDEAEKWEIPENLSQFSAWLLDKELNKINKRDEVEKMMMNDIMKLREQTIADFLKNTSSAEQKIILNSAGLTTGRKILETIQEIETRNIRKDKTDLDDFIDPFVLRPKPIAFDISSSLDHEVKDEEDNHEDEEEKDSSQSSEDSSDNSDSDKGALTEEYYSYNVNSHVSSMFKEPDCDEANTIEETAKGCNNANSFTTIENNKAEAFLASGHETETHAAAIGNAETPHGAVHHPPADSSSEPNLESTSIIGPAIPAAEILPPKVKDTTILRTEKQNHGEAAEAPSGEPIQKVDDDSTRDDSTSDVATSGEEGEKHSEGADLMTPAWEEEKERGAEGISTVEGVASHVLSEEDSPHAHHCDVDSRANVNTDKDDCALNGIIIIADGVTEKVNSGGGEEVEGCAPTSPAELFTSVDCAVKALDGGNESLACGAFREEEVHEEDSSPLETDVKPSLDSDVKSDSDVTDKPVCVNIERRTDTEKRVSRTPGNFFGPIDCVNAPLTVPSGILSTTLEDLTQIAKPDLIVGCSEASDPDLPVLRNEYKRSNSLGREPEEPSFEPLTSQSKSTPDLRRCQPNSSAPLSALLSKSVSQRIHDYLGRSDRLNRSLPPSERSRHYRRICVSTHTVVEKAAKFEARSKSTGPAAKPHEPPNGFFSKRSGSCPPNMRNSTWTNNRSYNKPTATVKPTIGVKESQFELITGYEKATKVTHKPPVPPSPNVHQSLKSARLKGKIASARRDFFERLSLAKSSVEVNRVQDDDDEEDEDEPGMGLSRFTAFRKSAREERARLAASHPDLGALEAAVRSSRRKIDQLRSESSVGPMPSTAVKGPYRRCTGEIAWASCAERLRAARAAAPPPQPLEIVDVRAHQPAAAIAAGCCGDFSRARSMDFLLDADNRDRVQPPENALAKARVKSEHELRIERSLQNLTIPDWYKQSAWSTKPKEGFILRRGSEGSGGESRKRWQGLGSSRTPSTTSLTSYSQRNIAVPKRVTVSTGDWRGSLVSSRESLTPASPASLSPRECSSAAFQYGLSSTSLSRWSSSRLSTSSAPLTALSVHRSFRQPYLGWRAAAASSSGGASPLNATTPVQGSSRPSSPRRGSQEQHFGYGLQQNQITSAATLRPDGSEAPDINRISPLALNTTNVFFNSHVEPPPPPQDDDPPRFPSTTEMRRDRYSYTQSLYSGSAAVLADDSDDRTNYNHPSQRDGGGTSPRVWMESSFVGTKRGEEEAPPPPRSIRIVPSTAAGGSTCATQTAMGEYVLRDFRRFGITL